MIAFLGLYIYIYYIALFPARSRNWVERLAGMVHGIAAASVGVWLREMCAARAHWADRRTAHARNPDTPRHGAARRELARGYAVCNCPSAKTVRQQKLRDG